MRTAFFILGFAMASGAPATAAQVTVDASRDLAWVVDLPSQERPDSSDLRKEARDAQNRFERRRSRLAHQTWGGSWGDCDEQVGRFCMRFTEGSWEPKPEVPEVVEERDRLIDTLVRVSTAIPGDPWVRGQLIWYLAESERPEEASLVAAACPTHLGWWCHAFKGFASHVEADYPTSERHFETAIAMADEEDRQEWTSVRDLLDRDGRKWLERQEEEGLDGPDALERFWLLSDPFYMVPGNERRTEHYARWLVARLREKARNAYGVSWGDDLRELLVRYGWEVGWERVRPRVGLLESVSMIGHQHPEAVQFVPDGEMLSSPESVAPGDWALESKRPQSTYAPAFALGVDTLPALYARFPRGDSTLLVVAYDRSWGDTLDGAREEGVFAARLDSEQDLGAFPSGREGGSPGTWIVSLPDGIWAVSAETLIREADRGARARFGVEITGGLPGVPTISDLLLFDLAGAIPNSLDEALATSQPLVHVVSESRIRAVWEVSGLGNKATALSYALEMERLDSGFFTRAARALRIVGEEEGELLTWTEAAGPDEDRVFRSIDLDLPPLDPGDYRLVLRLQLPGRTDMLVERHFRVGENPDTR